MTYTSRYDNGLLASYMWDTHAIGVDVPTARMESRGILMACVWFEREG